jgi:hypothetical protein
MLGEEYKLRRKRASYFSEIKTEVKGNAKEMTMFLVAVETCLLVIE